jgi:hypothetical protein
MREGWRGEDYLILFDESEIVEITNRYDIASYVGGYQVVGLKSWDDFILRNGDGQIFTTPTVPLDRKHLTPAALDVSGPGLVPDGRVKGKIKWYTKPLVFGGAPGSPDNICWITLDLHTQTVKWWNQLYRKVTQK